MILFKPWRKPTDLKGPNVMWSSAYASTIFNANMANVIRNMNIKNKCKDARDEYNNQKKSGNAMNPMLDDVIHESPGGDIDSLDTAVMNDNWLDRPDTYYDEVDIYDNAPIADVRNQGVQELVGLALKSGLFQVQMECDKVPIIKGSASQVADHEKDLMRMHKVLADEMKKDKRLAPLNDHESRAVHKRQRHEPTATLTELEVATEFVEVVSRCEAPFRPEDALEDVITELKIRGNVEQERAIRIVCEHFMRNRCFVT